MRRLEFLPWHHHPGHPDVVVPVRVDPRGRWGPTPKAARCGRWRALGGGWFVPAAVDPRPAGQRIVEAAVHLGPHGAVTGWAALHWMGGRWFSGQGAGGPRPVVLAGARVRTGPGVVLSQERLHPCEVVVVDGLRVTTAVRSVLFEMRYAHDVASAVQVLDAACFSDVVSVEELSTYGTARTSWTGIPQAREAWPLADENSWSPPESAMRLMWRGTGLQAPLTNRPLFDTSGRHLATPDLLDPVLGLVGEYDGVVHLDRHTRRLDVRRDDLYRRLGLEEVVMTAADLAAPAAWRARLDAAAVRARARPSTSPPSWTTTPPPWWRPTETVAQRRALAPADRARFLRHRAA